MPFKSITKPSSLRPFAGAIFSMLFWALLSAQANPPLPYGKKPDRSEESKKVVRKFDLNEYHSRIVYLFERTPGFGSKRFPIVMRKIRFDVVQSPPIEPRISPGEINPNSSLAKNERLKKVNERLANYFAKKNRIVIDPKSRYRVRLPAEASDKEKDTNKTTWVIRRLDLIGLLDTDNPVVYISMPERKSPFFADQSKNKTSVNLHSLVKQQKNRTAINLHSLAEQMKSNKGKNRNRKKLPTREPNLLEYTGVDYLKDGEELFVNVHNRLLRMVGALRAGKQCLNCHSGIREGDLLGAFSYTFEKN